MMSDTYDECITVLNKWKEYKANSGSSDLNGFANWLLKVKSEANELKHSENFIVDIASEMGERDMMPDLANRGLIGHLLGRMNLFVKNYAKTPMQQIGFSNLEEFRILQIIDRIKNINKSQLSNESLMEFSTVVDILKRLIKQGLIKQSQDENDKRASLLQITSKGKKLLNTSYQTLANLQPNVAGDLSLKEQENLIGLLLKLNNFHTDFFEDNYVKKSKKD